MNHESHTDPESSASQRTSVVGRRSVLRSLTAGGLLATVGVQPFVTSATAAIGGVSIDYKSCKVAFVSNASAIERIAVYYADSDNQRQAIYNIDPTTTDPRGYAPLVVEYDSDEDRTQIQIAEPRASLACVIAEAVTDRTIGTNPIDRCVPAEFNTAPTASFTVSTDPTVGEPVTFTSTATDPDDPERLSYEWDLDGDGTYETTGETASATYTETGEVTIRHRVTDDCGATDTTTKTVAVTGEEAFIKLIAADAEADDQFGYSVSVDGDTAIVGARAEDPDGKRLAGSAYVFTRSGGSWTQQQKLTADDAEASDNFGWSVSVDGDTAIVGARGEFADGIFVAGSAYVFTRSGGTWTQQQKLIADDAEARDEFGYSVSLDGDTALVGALAEDADGKGNAGSAYVFTRSGGTWTQQQKLNAADAGAGDFFGRSVSVDGDTALVGADGEDPDGKSQAGSAYVFTRSGGTWTQQQKLNAADAESGDGFGVSVSVDGDTALVGAPGEDPDGVLNAGSAYVFTRSGGSWTQQQKLIAADAETVDAFGRSVSVNGDTVLVGAWREDPDGKSNAGSAYVFTRSGGSWTQQQKLIAADAEAGDFFGFSVSIEGTTALVGAYLEDPDGKSDAGSAYVFSV